MSEALVPPKPNAQILDEASAWFVEFNEGEVSLEARNAFSAWLKASPEHVRAYLAVSATFDDLGRLGEQRTQDAQALIERVVAEGNVVELKSRSVGSSDADALASHAPEETTAAVDIPLRARQGDFFIFSDRDLSASSDGQGTVLPTRDRPGGADHRVGAFEARQGAWSLQEKKNKKDSWRARDDLTASAHASSRWNTPRNLLAASLAVLVLGLGALLLWANGQRGLYTTGIGEQRIVNLSDGSTIELNAESRVRVHLSDAERVVDLLEGQALFHVAKDPQRPFIVRSDTTRVRAVGTQFDVNRQESDTVVTVLEGRVAVARAVERDADAPSDEAPLYVSAGEQVILTAQAASRPAHPDVGAATAWRERKLVFASSPLPHVVGEYNRYHEKRLVIADPTLSHFRISGVFSAADAASLIAFLKVQSNIEVDERANEIVLRAK